MEGGKYGLKVTWEVNSAGLGNSGDGGGQSWSAVTMNHTANSHGEEGLTEATFKSRSSRATQTEE